MASDGVFLSALQPNSSVTTYGLPSNIRLVNGSSASDEVSRAQRVQQQVQMRLAEKSTLPRQNGSAAHYAMSGKPPLLLSPCCGSELGYRVKCAHDGVVLGEKLKLQVKVTQVADRALQAE